LTGITKNQWFQRRGLARLDAYFDLPSPLREIASADDLGVGVDAHASEEWGGDVHKIIDGGRVGDCGAPTEGKLDGGRRGGVGGRRGGKGEQR
jgi:hypothetical protein